MILSGKARLLHLIQSGGINKSSTLATLKADDFIGITSLLKGKSCEFVTASSDLLALSIPDKLILQIYNEELSFKDWCDNKIQYADAYEIALHLEEKSPKNKKSLKELVSLVLENSSIKTLNSGEKLGNDENIISLVGSANIINKSVLENLLPNEIIKTRGPLPARIYQIKKQFYSLILESINPKKSSPKDNKFNNLDIKKGDSLVTQSFEYLGQYDPGKKFKIIRAEGIMRESIACLQMITNEFKIPYRVDAVEKILRDTIARGKKPTIQLLGGITSMMGLHSAATKLDPKSGTRLPSLSLITWKDSFAIVKESNLVQIGRAHV